VRRSEGEEPVTNDCILDDVRPAEIELFGTDVMRDGRLTSEDAFAELSIPDDETMGMALEGPFTLLATVETREFAIPEESRFDDKALVAVMPDDDCRMEDDMIFPEERAAAVVATEAVEARDAELLLGLTGDVREKPATEEATEEIRGDAVREATIEDAIVTTDRCVEAAERAGEESLDNEADDKALDRMVDAKCTELPGIDAEETIVGDDTAFEEAIKIEDRNADTRVMLWLTDDGSEDAEGAESREETGTEGIEEGATVKETVEYVETLKDCT